MVETISIDLDGNPYDTLEAIPDERLCVEETVIGEMMYDELLRKLLKKERVMLSYIAQGYTSGEIAKMFSLNKNTTYDSLQKARKRLGRKPSITRGKIYDYDLFSKEYARVLNGEITPKQCKNILNMPQGSYNKYANTYKANHGMPYAASRIRKSLININKEK